MCIKKLRPALVVVLAVIALGYIAFGAASAQDNDTTEQEEVTAEQCRTAFNSSSANATCSQGIGSFSVDSGGRCRVLTACLDTFQMLRSTSITADLADVSNLSNCSGSLTVGSC